MAEYEVSNPLTDTISIRSGPGVFFERIGSMEPGDSARGNFIFTYRSDLVIDGQPRAVNGDQWVHITELEDNSIDGWTAIKHLGRSYAVVSQMPTGDLTVRFGVDLEGYNPITLTGTLTPK